MFFIWIGRPSVHFNGFILTDQLARKDTHHWDVFILGCLSTADAILSLNEAFLQD